MHILVTCISLISGQVFADITQNDGDRATVSYVSASETTATTQTTQPVVDETDIEFEGQKYRGMEQVRVATSDIPLFCGLSIIDQVLERGYFDGRTDTVKCFRTEKELDAHVASTQRMIDQFQTEKSSTLPSDMSGPGLEFVSKNTDWLYQGNLCNGDPRGTPFQTWGYAGAWPDVCDDYDFHNPSGSYNAIGSYWQVGSGTTRFSHTGGGHNDINFSVFFITWFSTMDSYRWL